MTHTSNLALCGVLATLAATAAPALASDDEEINHKIAIKELGEALQTFPAPAAGVDKAPERAPAWCGPSRPGKYTTTTALDSTRQQLSSLDRYWMDSLLGAAVRLCDADPKDAVVPKAAAFIEQHWMNRTGQSSDDAARSIRLRLNREAFEAGKTRLCEALVVSDEVGGAEKHHMAARRDLFDCGSGIATVATAPMVQLVPWMDSSAAEPDEMVRLALVAFQARATLAEGPDRRDATLPYYVMDQVDYAALAPDGVLALLEQKPYEGNPYAQAVVREELALARLRVAQIEAEVKARGAKDESFAELLSAAPRRGLGAWGAVGGKWRAELERSAEFEQKAYGPSRKAVAGCGKTLGKDLATVLGSYKRDTVDELKREITDGLIGGLLLERYVVCLAIDGDPMVAMGFIRHLKELRVVRGPRAAAYFFALDALAKIRDDRAKFPVSPEDLPHDRKGDRELLDLVHEILATKKYDTIGFTDVGQGVVKSAKQGEGGVAVTFNPQRRQIYTEACTTTSRILMWDHDGRPIYDRNCKPTGLKWVDVSPDPIVIADDLAAGIAPGKMLVFAVVPYTNGDRRAMPLEVYGEATGKKLIAFFGIGL